VIVISRAVVRDLHSGVAAARFFSLLMLVNGLAPILAPVIGGQILTVASWRGVFVVLTAIGVLLFLATATGLRETLAPERRHPGGVMETLRTFGRLLSDRVFVGHALACGLSFGAMFAYISGSPFVIQDIYGASPQLYSLMFAGNAVGLVVASQANRVLLRRLDPLVIVRAALSAQALAGAALVMVVAGGVGVWAVVPLLFVVVAGLGLVFPNATALALADHPRVAGSASGLLGVLQFIVGAAAAPLVGVGGTATALPMALTIAVLGAAGRGNLGAGGNGAPPAQHVDAHVHGQPEREEREHRVQRRQAGRIVARADETDLHRDEDDERGGHADVATGARPDDREDQQDRGEAVQDVAEVDVRPEARRAEDPEPGEEDLEDDEGGPDERKSAVGGGDPFSHRAQASEPRREAPPVRRPPRR
jgi:hypothetical protein